jgi:hypothetical protein
MNRRGEGEIEKENKPWQKRRYYQHSLREACRRVQLEYQLEKSADTFSKAKERKGIEQENKPADSDLLE